MSGQDSSRVNSKLPDSYNPVMNEQNFNAPSHQLSTAQKEQVAELAEASSGHIHGGSNVAGGLFGSGSHGSSGNTSNLADTLSATGGQQRGQHLGQYEYREDQLDEPRDSIGRGSGFGSTGHSSGLSGTGDGTRQSAGSGVGGGLAATAASQGLGSTTDRGHERRIEDQHIGGLLGDQSHSSNSRSGAGLGAGAGAAGLAGAGAYGASSGEFGHGGNRQEAISDLQGGHSRSGLGGSGSGLGGSGSGLGGSGSGLGGSGSGLGGSGSGLGGAGAGAAGAAGAAGLTSGQRDPSGHGAGAGEKGMLAQPQHETSLTSELERRAQKSGTHAAGFGTHGNE